MNTTSVFLSYAFLCIAFITLICFLYFKLLLIKTSSDSDTKRNIIGNMKDPDSWRARNNKVSYLMLFWTILSAAIFIYLKYFTGSQVISSIYLYVYIGAIIISSFLFSSQEKRRAS
jgi:hypothetical protein